MKKRKLVWSISALILLILTINIYQNYQQQVTANKNGICSETGTRLSEKELRAKVLENFLWQLLKSRDGVEFLLRNNSIAVVRRNIDKDQVISLIENSSGINFLNDIENDKNAVVFTRMDISGMMKSLGFFKYMLASDEYRMRRQEVLIRKVEKISKEDVFHGNFSIVIYEEDYDRESQDCGEQRKRISIIPGDTVF